MSDRNLSLLVKFAALDRLTGPMKNIAVGTRTAARGLTAAKKEVLALERAQAKIDGLKALRTGLGDTHAQLDATRRRMASLKLEIAQTDAPTKRLANSLAAAERKQAKLVSISQQQSTKLQTLQGELKEAGIDVGHLAASEEKLAAKLGTVNAKLKEQQDRMARIDANRARVDRAGALGSRMQGAGATASVAGAAIGAPLIVAGGQWREFQSGMTDIAQKANISRTEAEKMGRAITAMGPKLGQLPTALQGGLDQLAGFGLDPRAGMRMIAPIGKAATAYKAEIPDLSAATFAGVDNLKVPIADTTKMLDVMATAGKAGAFEIKDMARYFPALTASAQALGQRGVPAVADLAAALQIARKGAGDADAAGTNIQNLLAKINTEDTIKNFKDFGVNLPAAMKAAEAAGKSPIEAIADLSNRALKGDMKKLSFLFGDMQVQQALRPLIANMDLYRKIRSDALAASGTVETDFADRMRDGAAQAAMFDARMQALGVRVGSVTGPKIDALKGKFGALGERMMQWADRNPKLFSTLVTIGGVLAIVLVVFGALAIAIGVMLPGLAMLGTFFGGLATVLGVVWVGLTYLATGFAAVVGLPVILGVALAAAALAIWYYWDEIKGAFSAGLAWLGRKWGEFKSLGGALIDGLVGGIAGRLGALKSKIIGVATAAKNWFKGALGIHSPSRVFMGLGGFVTQGLALGIERGGRAPVEHVRRMADRIVGAMAISPPSPFPASHRPNFRRDNRADQDDLGTRLAPRRPMGAIERAPPQAVMTPARGGARDEADDSDPTAGFRRLIGQFARLQPLAATAKPQPSRYDRADRDQYDPLDRLRRISAQLAGVIAISATAPVTASPSAGGTASIGSTLSIGEIHIHLHQQPGQSGQDLAREVRAQIEALRRQDAAAARSSYRDDD